MRIRKYMMGALMVMATLTIDAVLASDALAQESARQALLMTPQQLSQALQQRSTVLLHIGPREDYDAGHIEGARFVGMNDLAIGSQGTPPLHLELPNDADLRARLEKLGVSDDSRIVVTFGRNYGTPATRILWTLQVAGLGDRSALLDGGTDAWRRAGLPIVTAVPTVTPGKLTRSIDRSLVVDHQWMQANFATPRVRLVDGRAPVFYEGPGNTRNGVTQPAGHIKGAVNLPHNILVNDSLKFLPNDALRRIFTDAGIQPGDTVAAYCHIGQFGTMVLFAARLLGHPVRLYDGSMNDWDNRKLPLVNEKAGTGQSPARERTR
jgi:thiosulfate/3-mercaptopyruvate sulfurtransferase